MFLNLSSSPLNISPRIASLRTLSIIHRLDLIIAACILVAVTCFTLALSHKIEPALFDLYADNAWFQADLARTSSNMVEVSSDHFRTKIHPIVSLITLPATKAIAIVWPGTRVELATRLIALVSGLWAAGLFLLCRMLKGSRWNAMAFMLLGLSSTSFIFFFSVPETFGLGSLTILLTLMLAAYLPKPLPLGAYVLASAASLSITVTNWMAGLALAFVTLPWRKAMRVTIMALLLVAFLALLQKWFVPSSRLFFLGNAEELEYINHQNSGGPLIKLTALLLHVFAAPTPSVQPQVSPYWPILTMQFSMPGSGSRFGPPALAIWISLLLLGIWGAWQKRHSDFVKVMALIIVGQVGLHLVYGDETVLYTLHLMAALLALTMLSLYAPLGRYTSAIVSTMAVLAALLAFVNNMQVYSISASEIASSLNQREQVQKAMRERPDEIWPRGSGHVVLASPGSELAAKAYHEPGASFSPSPGSFGASIWVSDKAGHVIATSETLPLAEIRQALNTSVQTAPPSLITSTRFFTASWFHDGNHSTLLLTPTAASKDLQLWLMLRSVGPAGGPLTQAQASPNAVVLNDKWHITSQPAFVKWQVADESKGKIALTGIAANSASSKSGWLYAAAMFESQKPATVTIQNTATAKDQARQTFLKLDTWAPKVPDTDFAASASAQQAHLLMGLSSGHTRPGDPMNYTYPWIRDAAYVIVALTKSGHLDEARQLSAEIAQQDFYGGFGAEADAPGLAIWALTETAQTLADPAFDTWLWSHIQRKAEWIQDCLTATQFVKAEALDQVDLRKPVITKPYRLCEPAREGLIVGRMDEQFPVLFINATAYAGLEQASRFADRLGHHEMAAAYQQSAQAVKLAWQREFTKSRLRKAKDAASHWPDLVHIAIREHKLGSVARNISIAHDWIRNNDNERTYVAAQWPAWVLGDSESLQNTYTQALNQRWNTTHDAHGEYNKRPDWTYFEFAQAHQWLLLGFPERAWETLNWFFKHQSSLGLYTWWEGSKEENTAHRWPTVRGWIKPDSVTPHYWAAAEALMLELDMLAYVDESKPQKPLVIGAGVPVSWLSQPLDSGVIYTVYGPVHWKWENDVLNIETTDINIPISLGATFHGAKVIRTKSKPDSKEIT